MKGKKNVFCVWAPVLITKLLRVFFEAEGLEENTFRGFCCVPDSYRDATKP